MDFENAACFFKNKVKYWILKSLSKVGHFIPKTTVPNKTDVSIPSCPTNSTEYYVLKSPEMRVAIKNWNCMTIFYSALQKYTENKIPYKLRVGVGHVKIKRAPKSMRVAGLHFTTIIKTHCENLLL